MQSRQARQKNIRKPIILEHIEQGSQEWLDARMGRITISKAKELLTKGNGVTRKSYLMQVASEIITGISAEKINSYDILRGNALEPYARQAYEITTGLEVSQVGLGYYDKNKRISASPDGLTEIGGVEFKCQAPKNHLKTIIEAKNPAAFEAQMQGCMWVFDVETWDYCSFCPEFANQPLFIIQRQRDEKLIKEIEASALQAVEEVDAIVRQGNTGRLNKKLQPIINEALDVVDIILNRDPDII